MKMNKTYLLGLLILCYQTTVAQNFETKIKDNASIVFSIHGANLLDKVSENEIDVSQLFFQIKKELRLESSQKLSDIGLEFNSTMMYAMENDSNMLMNMFFIKIADLKKFEQSIVQLTRSDIKTNPDGYQYISKRSGREQLIWNSEFLAFVSGTYIGNEFQNSYKDEFDYKYYKENRAIEKFLETKANMTLSPRQISDSIDKQLKYSYQLSDYEKEIEEYDKKKSEEAYEYRVEEAQIEDAAEAVAVTEEVYEEVVLEEAMADAVEEVVEEVEYDNYYNTYDKVTEYRRNIRNKINNKRRTERREKREAFTLSYIQERNKQLFQDQNSNSILTHKGYSNSIDKKADAVLWINNGYLRQGFQTFLSSVFGRRYFGRGFNSPSILANSVKESNSTTKLYFEKKGIKISQSSDNTEEEKQMVNSLLSTKQDTRMYDYVDGDNVIGYFSSSFNSEELIKAIPKTWVNSYSNIYRNNISEEMNVLAEVVEVFLDEKAIGEIASGNLFFVFKDMKKKEVTYQTNEYDENYNYVKVEKTKTELLPDFLMMISTENKELLEKIVKLGVKHNVVRDGEVYYTTQGSKSDFPLNLYFAIKEGIIFITPDEQEIIMIVNGKSSYKGLSKKHQKLASNNSQVFYMNSEKIMDFVPDEAIRRSNREKFSFYKKNGIEEVLITTKNENGNTVSEGFVSVPKKEKNSAKYLFELLNDLIEMK